MRCKALSRHGNTRMNALGQPSLTVSHSQKVMNFEPKVPFKVTFAEAPVTAGKRLFAVKQNSISGNLRYVVSKVCRDLQPAPP